MTSDEAKELLHQHKEALDKLLGDDLKSEALEHAKGAKLAKKTLIGRLKELPVVEKISSLGTAGTVAVGTAAATQADLAINYTEIVVAQVAEDVYEGIIEPPFLFDMIDYEALHIWGQEVIAEKVAEVSELQQTSQPSPEPTDPTPAPDASSPSTDDGKPSQSKPTESSPEPKAEQTETKESKSSEPTEAKADEPVKQEIPKVETPFEQMGDDIKPHSSVRLVSPTN